jgi:hypothetical protein
MQVYKYTGRRKPLPAPHLHEGKLREDKRRRIKILRRRKLGENVPGTFNYFLVFLKPMLGKHTKVRKVNR